MKSDKILKIVGLVGAGLGLAATALKSWCDDKKLKETVAEEVQKALTKQND